MIYKLTWLAEVLRKAGLRVVEQPQWKDRGVGDVGTIRGIICHHTAGAKTGNAPSLSVVQNGRSDLRGPLSQLVLGRDGTYYVVAAGACNHAGKGNWQGVTNGNTEMIGIEAENAGVSSDPWPDDQKEAYAKGCAAILKHLDLPPMMCCGHKEYALPRGRKPDPTFDMDSFRRRVAQYMGQITASLPRVVEPMPVKAVRTVTSVMRKQMCDWIVFNETGKKPGEKLKVIAPAVGDGGAFEVAGITEKHHPDTAVILKDLVESGANDKAWDVIREYYLKYTNFAVSWSDNQAGVEAILRDCGIHRGPKGAAIILQKAVRVEEDGIVGRDTMEAATRLDPSVLINNITAARERYEREVVGYREQFWRGFHNRWNRMNDWALQMQKDQAKAVPKSVENVLGAGGGGTFFGYIASWFTNNVWVILAIGLVAFAIILAGLIMGRRKTV